MATGNEEITLKQVVDKITQLIFYMKKKWVLLALSALIGGIVGIIYSLYQNPIYTATTTFVLEEGDSGGSLNQYGGLAAMAGIDIASGTAGLFRGDNLMELYKSRNMLRRALLTEVTSLDSGKQLLIERYISMNNLRKSWDAEIQKLDFEDSTKFTQKHDSIIISIIKDINHNYLKIGKLDKKLSIIKVDVSAADQNFALIFNKCIVSTVNNFYIETKTKKSTASVAILQHQVDSVRTIMSGELYNTARVADRTPNLNPARQVLRIPAQKSQYNVEINKEMLSEMIKSLELSKATLAKETPLIQVIDGPILPLDKKVLGKKKAALIGGALILFLMFAFLTVKWIITDIKTQING